MNAVTILFSFVILVLVIVRQILRCLIKRCRSPVMLSNKVVVVTGANSGVGFETARALAARGARVILACRNPERGVSARDKIISETGNVKVVFKHLDLSSLTSVRRFAEDIIATEEYLHVLVNNAGAYGLEDKYTVDGILELMQVNYFGPYLLTLLLLPLLKQSQPSRIVNVSSISCYAGRVELQKINRPGSYWPLFQYCNSKLCLNLFTKELSKHLQDSGVIVNALHPGAIDTNITHNINTVFMKIVIKLIGMYFYRTAEEGAQTAIYLSIAEECTQESGYFYVDCQKWWDPAYEGKQSCLWKFSEELVKFRVKLE